MKIHMHNNGFVMVGKAWEIRAKLKEYQKKFQLMEDWLRSSGFRQK
jgi:Mother cell inhibitor of FtsZ